jgi:hypothetical protein
LTLSIFKEIEPRPRTQSDKKEKVVSESASTLPNKVIWEAKGDDLNQ